MDWTTACPDWERRIVAGESLIPFDPLFPAEAAAALETFKSLRMVDATGSPTFGDVSRRWVTDFVASIFGAYDPDAGRRLITEFFMLISKKNGKSSDASGIMMTSLLRNWRASGEFLILAPTIEIANNSFNPARDMVRADEELKDILHVQEHYRTITHRETGATLKVVAADSDTVGGKKAIGVLVDELWLFGKDPKAENMLREATGGLASRPEGFTIFLSTQSDQPPAGVFAQKLQYARDVRDGRVVDKQFLPVLYEFPRAMLDAGEHRKAKHFYVTNPNLGASVDEQFLTREFKKAERAGEQSMCGFLAKHLNVEIGLALMSDRWAGADYWERQGTAGLTLEAIFDRSDVLTVGIDFGGSDDWLAVAVLGRDGRTGDWLHWGRVWAHQVAFDRRKGESARWQDFVDDGDLVKIKNIGDDVVEVVDLVMRCEETGLLDRVGVDAYKIQEIADTLVDRGIDRPRIVAISQGWKLVGSILTSERKLAAGKMHHGGTKIMAYAVGNAKVVPKGNAVAIDKQTSGSAKIDPLMALFNAVAPMSDGPEPKSPANYLAFLAAQTATA